MGEEDGNVEDGLFWAELGFEYAFACIVAVLLLNGILHYRIKFGDMLITHMTTLPYKRAYVFIFFALIQNSYLLVLSNIVFKGDFDDLVSHWHDNSLFKCIFACLELCKFGSICNFVFTVTFENSILALFVKF